MLRTSGLLYVAIMVLLSCAFQYQSKLLANDVGPILARAASASDKVQALVNGPLIARLAAVLLLAGALFVVWVLALTKLDLSVALPLASIALIVNAVGTGLLLGEGLSPLRIGGVIVVAVGILMVLKS